MAQIQRANLLLTSEPTALDFSGLAMHKIKKNLLETLLPSLPLLGLDPQLSVAPHPLSPRTRGLPHSLARLVLVRPPCCSAGCEKAAVMAQSIQHVEFLRCWPHRAHPAPRLQQPRGELTSPRWAAGCTPNKQQVVWKTKYF